MKLRKLIFAAAGVLLLGIGAFLASAFNKTNSHSSDLVSANIEVLADSEAGGDCATHCPSNPNYDCVLNYTNGASIYCFNAHSRN